MDSATAEHLAEDSIYDSTAWKSDKSCAVCSEPFADSAARFCCKFCFRGVCRSCAAHRHPHKQFSEPQRCCRNCLAVLLETDPDLLQKQHKLHALRQRVQDEEHEELSQLQATCSDLQREIAQLQASSLESPGPSAAVLQENAVLKEKTRQVEEEHMAHNQQLLEALQVLKQQINQEQAQNKQLKGQCHLEESEVLTAEIQNDQDRIAQLQRELQEQQQQLQALHQAPVPPTEQLETVTARRCRCQVF